MAAATMKIFGVASFFKWWRVIANSQCDAMKTSRSVISKSEDCKGYSRLLVRPLQATTPAKQAVG